MAVKSEWKRYKWYQHPVPVPVVAVKTLLDTGFRKLDEVVLDSLVRDKLFLFIWDLIIIEKAAKFATCSDCGVDNYCSKCNYNGNTVKYVMEIRSQIGKDSQQCWPDQNS